MSNKLDWPTGWKRTDHPRQSRFHVSLSIKRAMTGMLAEFDRLGASSIHVSTNVPMRQDGLPYSTATEPSDSGVAVYFDLNGQQSVLACDQWDRVAHNMHAISKHVDALRGIDRWGVGTIEQAFTGYAALPEKGGSSHESWWSVLGCKEDDSVGYIKRRFAAMSAQMEAAGIIGNERARLNEAYAEAKTAKSVEA